MRQFLILVLVPTILALTGCETTTVRTPTVSNKTAVDYHKSPVRDIAVLPIKVAVTNADDSWLVPAVAIRRSLLKAVVGQKNYVSPRTEWVDQQLEKTPGSAADLNTDAILSVVIDQWDESRIRKNGAIYVGARFQLRDLSQRIIWEYSCHDVRLTSGSRVIQRVEEVRLDAAAGFIRQVVGTMPKKQLARVGS